MEFEKFCRDMHTENCIERQQFNEPTLTFDEYVKQCFKFLTDRYEEEIKQENQSSS